MTPGENVKAAVKAIGSQKKTARLLGVGREAIRQWQHNGMDGVASRYLFTLADLAGMDPRAFCGRPPKRCACGSIAGTDSDGGCVGCGR